MTTTERCAAAAATTNNWRLQQPPTICAAQGCKQSAEENNNDATPLLFLRTDMQDFAPGGASTYHPVHTYTFHCSNDSAAALNALGINYSNRNTTPLTTSPLHSVGKARVWSGGRSRVAVRGSGPGTGRAKAPQSSSTAATHRRQRQGNPRCPLVAIPAPRPAALEAVPRLDVLNPRPAANDASPSAQPGRDRGAGPELAVTMSSKTPLLSRRCILAAISGCTFCAASGRRVRPDRRLRARPGP